MDFLHRNANGQPQAARTNGGGPAPVAASGGSNSGDNKFRKALHGEPRWLRAVFLVLLFSVTILAVAIAMLFYFGKSKEAEFVDHKKVQAVFLTNGQVYFGKIVDVTGKYINLQNIYYLNSQQQPETSGTQANTQQTSFSLVKLGCELHGPVDQMIINREQVSFWENLMTNGKVAKAIDQWVQQNPNGQNCDANASNSSSTTGTTQPNGTTSNTTNKKQ